MIYFENQTEEQNKLLDAIRKNVCEYIYTLQDVQKQADAVISFENFLKKGLKLESKFFSDSTQQCLDTIPFCAGLMEGLSDYENEEAKRKEKDFKSKPWKRKRKGNH